MFPHNTSPLLTKGWKNLQKHFQQQKGFNLRAAFADDPERFNTMHIKTGELVFDYSKNLITEETMAIFSDWCDELNLREAIQAQFNGLKINQTENRAVLHTALRDFSTQPIYVDNKDIKPEIVETLSKMKTFSDEFTTGKMKGSTGKVLNTIVHIGIGGSDLGPQMVAEALKSQRLNHIAVHFVSNVDGAHLLDVLKVINPETVLFIVASKTFTTQETMANAEQAKSWLIKKLYNPACVSEHFVAISVNKPKVAAFGIAENRTFALKDWVGGRFSLWSSIGLSICCSNGFEAFELLLKGANAADLHFRTSPWNRNIPVIMALTGIWYHNFYGAPAVAILPYCQHLHRFPAYLQQTDMESNGKSTDRNGEHVSWSTGPIIFGEAGTNGQHAFYQLMHQGTHLIPSDFIGFSQPVYGEIEDHDLLMSNFFAQTEALMKGKTYQEASDELKKEGKSEQVIEILAPFKVFNGNIPSNTFLFKKLDAYNLGMLIALYEHKIFVQGYFWNIFSYDQWGVELGKQLAGNILQAFNHNDQKNKLDGSTSGMLSYYEKMKNRS